ncbi:MAG: transglutaminase domain-containing protein [Chitinophagaceae bacterium]
MKCLFIIWFLFATTSAYSQQDRSAINAISHKERIDEVITPASLAQQLTLSCSNDMQKVRAIFYWITENIAYRTKPVRSRKKPSPDFIEDNNDTTALKPLDERVAETVLENRLAVCDGYARLFKTLCRYSGIQAEVINGYARTEASKKIQRFRPNHSWNAVWLDSAWHLLDVTWASGFISWHGADFVRHLDEQYFLSTPDQFMREHYPDDLRWTLMADPPLMPEFRHSPFKQKSFSKYQITDYNPVKGIIEASPGDTITIELETADAAKDRQVSSDPFLDTALYSSATSALLVPSLGANNKIIYTYIAGLATIQWLYILYNDDIIMRYSFVLKNPNPVMALNEK